jgi:hypothetical protein
MLRWVFFGLLYVSSLLANDTIDCKILKKVNNTFITCGDKFEGFVFDKEQVESFKVSYKNNEGKRVTETIPSQGSIQDLLDNKKIKEILERGGILNASDIKIESVSVESSIPLYKDPEKIVLKSGCQTQGAPVVISYSPSEGCNDYLCVASVECVGKTGSDIKDAICKAKLSQEGVTCPSASSCLSDEYVTVETYLSPSTRGSSGSSRGSKGSAQ